MVFFFFLVYVVFWLAYGSLVVFYVFFFLGKTVVEILGRPATDGAGASLVKTSATACLQFYCPLTFVTCFSAYPN